MLVKEVMAEVLEVEISSVGGDFYSIGGDSLSLLKVVSVLEKRTGKKFSSEELSPIPEDLAAVLTRARDNFSSHPNCSLAWLADRATILGSWIPICERKAGPTTQLRDVFLTGATGFLGRFLLRALIRKTSARLFCLINAKSTRHARDLSAESINLRSYFEGSSLNDSELSRVVPIQGDLESYQLGLSEEIYTELARKVDVIYHCGAKVSYAASYEYLEGANAVGTAEILRLAGCDNLKAIHYVSSTAAVPLDGDLPMVLETDLLDYQGELYGGYSQSKWIAERLVADANKRGLPAIIYRPGRLIGDSEKGHWNTNDLLRLTLSVCLKVKQAPDLETSINICPVDHVADVLIELSMRAEPSGQVFHLTHPKAVPWLDLVGVLQKIEPSLRRVSFREWKNTLLKNEQRFNEIAVIKRLLPESEGEEISEEAIRLIGSRSFDIRSVAKTLGDSLFYPALDTQQIRRCFRGLERLNRRSLNQTGCHT